MKYLTVVIVGILVNLSLLTGDAFAQSVKACFEEKLPEAIRSEVSRNRQNYEIACKGQSDDGCIVLIGIQQKYISLIECLSDSEYDFNVENGKLLSRRVPVILAAETDPKILKKILDSRIRVEPDTADDSGFSALNRLMTHLVVKGTVSRKSKYVESVKILLDKGANPNLLGRFGSPLYVASIEGNDVLVELLLSKGADPNWKSFEGQSILMVSADNKNILEKLIISGADITATDRSGRNAAHYAAERCQIKKLQTLYAKDPTIFSKPNLRNKTALDLVQEMFQKRICKGTNGVQSPEALLDGR